jgi:hypothetical protein
VLADFRHRALRHHAEGIFLCERVFGVTLTNSAGKAVPVRWVAEQHVKEDLGWIPTAADWLKEVRPRPWMGRTGGLPLTEQEKNAPAPEGPDRDGVSDTPIPEK